MTKNKFFFLLSFLVGIPFLLSAQSRKDIASDVRNLDCPQGKALIYIFQDTGGKKLDVSINGEEQGYNNGKEFMYLTVKPGGHVLSSEKASLSLNFEEGKTYYIRQQNKKKIELVGEMEGKRMLLDCKLSKDQFKLLKEYQY